MTTRAADRLRDHLPQIADQVVAAIVEEVPPYTDALDGPMGAQIAEAVRMALGGFLTLAERRRGADPGSPLQPALDAAYALGRGEARSGRTMDALLAAYRVGARVAWREMAAVAVATRLSAGTLARFAELVFAYIDELSAASVSGHADEIDAGDRGRRRYRERLARALLAGDPPDVLQSAAVDADWLPPGTLTAVLLPGQHYAGLRALTTDDWLVVADDLPDVRPGEDLLVWLVPDLGTRDRARLRAALAGRRAVIGPARPWTSARASFTRALRAQAMHLQPDSDAALDTDDHLAELVVGSDAEALADLRTRVLAPLASLRPATAEKLTETLRLWLLHHGRREDVAEALFVHPQTVRYRMTQLRDLFGDRLQNPADVYALTVALGPGS